MKRLLPHRVEGPRDGCAVVLLHPIATHGGIWAAQVPIWARRLRLVIVDLPGHGESAPLDESAPAMRDYACCVRDVLDALRIDRAALAGVSLGGMVAQAFALAFPERTRALVLAHTSAQTSPSVRAAWSERLALAEQQGLAAQVDSTLARWFTPEFAAAAPLTLAWVADQIRATSPGGYAAAVRAIQGLDHLDALQGVRAPTLVVAGTRDAAVPPAAASAIAERIPGARQAVLEDAAHLGMVQQPVAFTEVVGRFLHQVLGIQETS